VHSTSFGMVLESLISSQLAEEKPYQMLIYSFLFTTVGIFLAWWVFASHASIVMVFLTVSALLPLMIRIIGFEKLKSEHYKGELSAHEKAIPFFIFMFLGMVLSFAIWYIVLPETITSQLYSVQSATIQQITRSVSGGSVNYYFMSRILLNNLRVLGFAILFSFLYGAGAIFILTWNASVVSVAIGNTFSNAYLNSKITGGLVATGFMHAFSVGLFRYMLHGIPEVLAYFIGGLAGGIISVGILKHEIGSSEFFETIYDAFSLVMLSVGVLFLAAFIEVAISPLLTL